MERLLEVVFVEVVGAGLVGQGQHGGVEAAGEVVEGKEDLARFDRRREGRGDEDGGMTDCCVRTE